MATQLIPSVSSAIPLAVIDGQPRVDSRLIAEQLGVEHESTRKIIEQYLSDFEEFGVSRFEIGKPPKGSSGGRPEKFYLLNEDQSYLLLTYSQNTEQARDLKKRMVRSFSNHRELVLQGQLAMLERFQQPALPRLQSELTEEAFESAVYQLRQMDRRKTPEQWRQWYLQVIELRVNGYTFQEIGRIVRYSSCTVAKRLRALMKQYGESA